MDESITPASRTRIQPALPDLHFDRPVSAVVRQRSSRSAASDALPRYELAAADSSLLITNRPDCSVTPLRTYIHGPIELDRLTDRLMQTFPSGRRFLACLFDKRLNRSRHPNRVVRTGRQHPEKDRSENCGQIAIGNRNRLLDTPLAQLGYLKLQSPVNRPAGAALRFPQPAPVQAVETGLIGNVTGSSATVSMARYRSISGPSRAAAPLASSADCSHLPD